MSDKNSSVPPGFRKCELVHYADRALHTVCLLLPSSFTDEEVDLRLRAARVELVNRPYKSPREPEDHSPVAPVEAEKSPDRKGAVKRAKATKPSEPPRSTIGDLDAAAEREFLKKEAKVGTRLARRSWERVLNARHAKDGQLFVKVFEWDEVMKLVARVGTTADRDWQKRNKQLFLRIRKMHPHHMRPVGYRLQDHEAVLESLVQIGHQLPHFAQVLSFVRERLCLSFKREEPMHIPPMLLLGEPGIGKTHFTNLLSEALRLPVHRHSLDGGLTDSALIGSDKRWSNSATGLVFESLVLGQSASPIILLDEIDKARSGEQGNALGPLHSLLEPVSAKAITDISSEITMDASHVVWIATANEPLRIPAPIRSRMREFLIEVPKGDAALRAADAIARSVHERMDCGLFDAPDRRVIVSLAHLPARELIQALEAGYARALECGSRAVQRHHLPADVFHDADGKASDDSGTPPGGYLH